MTIVALAALALTGCGQGSEAPAAEPATSNAVQVGQENIVVVDSITLEAGPMISGSLRPEHEAAVRAEIAGSVLQTMAEKGQPVRRGQVIARIDDSAIRDQFLSARAATRTAEQAAAVAHRNAERAAKLAEAGAIADRDLEQARWNAMSADAQVADARARLAQAEKQLDKTQVRAPISGIVSERQVNAGDVVQPGAPVFTIIDPGEMRLEASVPSEQLSFIRVGSPVHFRVSGYPGRTFTGRVARINPAADPVTRQVQIYVTVPNTGGQLVAGLFAEGRVSTQARRALSVPITAVDFSTASPTVLRIRSGVVEKVAVQVGLRDESAERIEIVAGLSARDTVLAGLAQGIAPGTPVKLAEVPRLAPAESK